MGNAIKFGSDWWYTSDAAQINFNLAAAISTWCMRVPLVVGTQYTVAETLLLGPCWQDRPPPTWISSVVGICIAAALFAVALPYEIYDRIDPGMDRFWKLFRIGVPVVVFGGFLFFPIVLTVYCKVRPGVKAEGVEKLSLDLRRPTDLCGSHELSAHEISGAAPSDASPKDCEPDDVEANSEESHAANEEESKATTSGTEEKTERKNPSLWYISNIKIFLTCFVIANHAINSCISDMSSNIGFSFAATDFSNYNAAGIAILLVLTSIGQNFAMGMFFFIAGFFTPRSLDKRGSRTFLLDRFKRLGIPLVLYTYLLQPHLMPLVSGLLVIGQPLDLGVTALNVAEESIMWFVVTLLSLNVAYALACGENWNPRVNFSLGKIILAFFGVGTIQAVVTLFLPLGYFFVCNFFFGFWGMYVLCFFGGAIAQRNGWVEDMLQLPRGKKAIIYGGCFLNFVAVALTIFLPAVSEWAKTGNPALVSIVDVLMKSILATSVAGLMDDSGNLNFACGIPTALWIMAVYMLSFKYGNWEVKLFSLTKHLSRASYTAYMLQFLLPVQAAFAILVSILNRQGEDLQFSQEVRVLPFPKPNVVSYGILSSLFAILFDFSLATALVHVPGLSNIL